ncbi:MAG TPA: Ku protein [Candidatus Sulfotelmatobacter sp.]|nr:Ku protein [Candidatus Sulfotelmatobacter sp.]
MRAIWKGSISFGLVSIPISLFPATQREEVKFRLLRKSDLSPINYKRVAEADGKEVPWDQVVKGFEYEKDKFVVVTDEDFERADIKATQTVDIMNFVRMDEINPILFYKPYYMQAEKGGDKAYVLLRNALEASERIGIAKVVIKTRQHLAAIKSQKKGLLLELMHFPEELVDVSSFKAPATLPASKPEMNMAAQLIESMSTEWKPEQYHDDYHESLKRMIDQKIERGDEAAPGPKKARKPANVVDLVSVLQQSIKETQKKSKPLKKAA